MQMKPLAIVLLNYNGIALLKQFLSKVLDYSPEATVSIIDNNSTDGSVDWLTENYPSLQCVELDKNLGYAGGYNEGLKQIKAKIYCLLNTDVLVTPDWLPPILNHFKTNPKTAVIQPHILDYKKPSHFEYAGAAGGYLDANGIPFCRGRIFSNLEEDLGQYDIQAEIFWASGACFFIRSKQFWELKGFDTDFFAHQEEIDLCWRMHNYGFKTMAIGSSKVYHIGGATLSASPKKVFLNHRNSLFMLIKNLPEKDLYKRLFIRLLLDGLAGVYYVFSLNFSSVWAIIRAHFSFYLFYRSMIDKRTLSNKSANYYHIKNIVVKYFFQKKLNFLDFNKE
jgi:GT2 family glycosyltransferase